MKLLEGEYFCWDGMSSPRIVPAGRARQGRAGELILCRSSNPGLLKGRRHWTHYSAKRSTQSILKEISPEYSLGGLMLNPKLQYFGYLMRRANSLEKTLMLGKIEGRRRMGDGWMVSPIQLTWVWASSGRGWRTGNLASCSPWGHKEMNMTDQLNNYNSASTLFHWNHLKGSIQKEDFKKHGIVLKYTFQYFISLFFYTESWFLLTQFSRHKQKKKNHFVLDMEAC